MCACIRLKITSQLNPWVDSTSCIYSQVLLLTANGEWGYLMVKRAVSYWMEAGRPELSCAKDYG